MVEGDPGSAEICAGESGNGGELGLFCSQWDPSELSATLSPAPPAASLSRSPVSGGFTVPLDTRTAPGTPTARWPPAL